MHSKCTHSIHVCHTSQIIWCLSQGLFRVYPLPGDPNQPMPPRVLNNLPPSAPEECIVRVYIIKALDLQPNDPSGLVILDSTVLHVCV